MAKYMVVGRIHKVFGASYGEVIEKDLSKRQERSLIEAGHIVPVPTKDRPYKAVVLIKELDNAYQAGSPELLH